MNIYNYQAKKYNFTSLIENLFECDDLSKLHEKIPEDKKYNETLEKDYHDNSDVGTEGLYKNYTRLSFVCYLREKIAKCPNKDKINHQYLTKSGHGKIIIE